MFSALKATIWIIGILVVARFAMGYFGYEFNLNYFNERKNACQENFQACAKNLVRQGVDNADCDIVCVDPSLIIKRN